MDKCVKLVNVKLPNGSGGGSGADDNDGHALIKMC